MNYINDLIKNKLRPDGRNFLQYRDIKVSYDASKWAEGSAIVTIGKTRVVVGIKMDIGEPYPDTPDKGALITSAEFIPFASPDFEPGPPSEVAVELARVVDRGIRESETIDMKKLCLVKGEKVWLVFIDIYILNHDGNLMDAAALGALAALQKAKIPKLDKEGKVIREKHDKALPITKQPIAITFYKINGEIVLDTTKQEEDAATAKLTVTYDKKGNINAMQKSLSGFWTIDEIKTCVNMGDKYAQKLRKVLK